MSLPLPRLSGHQKELIRGSLTAGCDRAASAKAAAATLQEFNNELKHDAEFAKAVLQAEGGAVFHRMNAIHKAVKDPKQWRAAAWWLEQQTKRHNARLKAKQVPVRHWHEYAGDIVGAVMSEVSQEADRERLVERLRALFKISDVEAETQESEPHE